MKKIFFSLLLLLTLASLAPAQTTPNYNFQVPPFNAPNWNTSMNQDWFLLDSILAGFAVGNQGGLQCKPLASFTPPPSGFITLACVSDAIPGSNPCTIGGSGAFAVGLNGSYNCAGTGSGPGGGLNDPGANGIIFRNALNITRPALFADLAALATGTPNSSFFLRGDGTWSAPAGSGVTSSATSPGPIGAYFGTAPSTQIKGDPNCLDDFLGHINCLGLSAGIISATGAGANGPIYANNGTTGTTAGLLAKIAAGAAINATTSDTAVPVALVLPTVTNGSTTICGPGTTGNVCLAYSGQAACTVDAAGATANHFVVASTSVAGTCHDAGTSLPSGPVCVAGTFAANIAGSGSGLINAAPACYGSGTGVGDPGVNGYMVRTALNTSVARSITAGTGISISNSDGTAGNTQVAVDATVATATSPTVFTQKTADAEASGNVFSRPFYEEFTASGGGAGGQGAFDPPTTGAATFSSFGSTTTQGAVDFLDAVTSTVVGHFTLPQGWTGNMDARVTWFANLSSSNSARISVATGCVADAQAISTGPSYNTASAANTAYTGTANQRKTTTLLAVPMTNCAAGETMYFQLSRIGADAGDTLAATVEVISIDFEGRYTF